MKKLACLLLLTALLLCGCGSRNAAYTETKFAYGSREPAILLDGKALPRDLYDYYFLSYEEQVRTEAEEKAQFLLTPVAERSLPDEDAIRLKATELTVGALRHFLAVRELAAGYGLTLPKEALSEIEKTVNETAESDLLSAHASAECLYNLLQNDWLEALLYDYMTEEATGIIDSTDATVDADLRERFMAAVQIYIPAGNDRAAALEKAQVLLENAKTIETAEFVKTALAEGDSYGIRYFTDGYTEPFFEEAVKALQPGETSGIIESGMGYHIIRRVALDEDYLRENFESLRYDYLTRCYNELLAEKADGYKVTYPEA